MSMKKFSKDVLNINAAEVTEKIEKALREQVAQLKRRGVVVGLSGGIDSSVTAALCTKALGRERVLGLFMPELDSSDDSMKLGRLLADSLGVESVVEDIGPLLEAAGCYRRRDEAIRAQVPEYRKGYKSKIVLANILEKDGFNFFHLVVESDKGERKTVRLNVKSYLGIVAATNMKQRARKFFEYYHADRLQYVVAGTPNRLEYDQGFFVKNGDGAADIKPIAHLYKTQVYQLAAYLGVPAEIRQRPPTTDTYSLPQSQEEFYFSLPYDKMDLCLYAKNAGVSAAEVAGEIGLTAQQVERVYRDIDAKRNATRYMHSKPLLVEEVGEILI
ncbi:MAG: NAD(+) synthase [Candidatus Manganitrophus sp.]|nr:NAD(+) synthase [Candidatus Manganitrophus sp.]MDC4226027.1 NAD(+) synthase [Candidatus Manganitrophus sp.]WDT72717.1 MAG: NAD(+) synthase [Candidatus Manganitrophus sp.]